MYSDELPSIEKVKDRYQIEFEKYSILMYHPVTTEVYKLENNIKEVVSSVIESNKNYIVIYPNNDNGSETILKEFKRFEKNKKIKIYPSMRFEYFLTLLKNCEFIMGNSSSGIREACVYGKIAIDIGKRQQGRYDEDIKNIIHVNENKNEILKAIEFFKSVDLHPKSHFGEGDSDKRFLEIISNPQIWEGDIQKRFIDINF